MWVYSNMEAHRISDETSFFSFGLDSVYRATPATFGENIARKLLQNWHTSSFGGATSHLALKSRMLTVNDVYTPTTV